MSPAVVDRATELLEMIEGKWTTQAIGVAAELGIADHLAAGTDRVEALAEATVCDDDALERLMHGLVSLGVCAQRPDHSYELTPLGELLRERERGSMRGWAIWNARYHWPRWGRLIDSVRSGKSASVLGGGTDGYAHLERDPDAAAAFNRGIGGITYIVGTELARRHDFSRARRIVDVGGGDGQLLAAILEHHPHLSGVLFDLPHAIQTAPPIDRCEPITGDFFEEIPPAADAYLMKSILHNWDDAASLRILRQCRRALHAEASLLIVERVLPETLRGEASERPLARSDLNMLVGFSGRERTLADFDALLEPCGFARQSCQALALGFSLIEAR
jgi:hypothetical protein